MINGLLNDYNVSNKEVSSTLDSYKIDELINLFITYSRPKYFLEHENMEEILTYISSYILKNISKVSFLDILDFFTNITMELMDTEKIADSIKRIISIRTSNLSDDFFMEMEAKSFGVEKNKFIENYKKELNSFRKQDPIYSKIIVLLDEFQKDLFNYLNTCIEQLSDDDIYNLLGIIRKKVEENSNEIIMRTNKKTAYSRINKVSADHVNEYDTSFLEQQNYIYYSFLGTLSDIKKNNINK